MPADALNLQNSNSFFERLYRRLKRKTNSTSFIPQIDGLRFLAIMMVVLYHINIFVTVKAPFAFSQTPASYWWLYGWLDSDRKGVFLFFIISGFILALPFAKAAFGHGKTVLLKEYYLRRLTRLEPPYFFVMIACFFGILLMRGHEFASTFPHTFFGLLPRLLASLIYSHNIIFPKYLSLNPVAWSLEIEVQFYLTVPLLVKVFKLKSFQRRLALILAVIFFICLQHVWRFKFDSLYNYIQYFLLGFLLADLYLNKVKFNFSFWLSGLFGFLSLVYVLFVDLRPHNFNDFLFPVAALSLYLTVLTDSFWSKIFSIKWITSIGGMCYSIYLLHYNIIPLIGNKTIFYNISKSYPVTYVWHTLILLPIVLLISSAFYLLIERPCMDKDWPKNLWGYVKIKLSSLNF